VIGADGEGEGLGVGPAVAGAAVDEGVETTAVGVAVATGDVSGGAVGVAVATGDVSGGAAGVAVATGSDASAVSPVGEVDSDRLELGGEVEAPGVGDESSDCGTGFGWTSQSARLSFVSSRLPSVPPGRRSMLDRAAGAGAGEPSTNEFAALPQPTESTTVPPT
jgi:hypothetical protein